MATSEYTRDVLRVVVAQICQTIGWHAIHTTPLEVLTDVLSRYIHSLGTSAHRYGEQFGHTQPTIVDIALAFKDLGVSVTELEEYVQYVAPVPCAINVPKYPVERESHLNLLKPGSREVVTRPVHIHEHLPAMHPQLEEEEPPLSVDITGSESGTSPLSSPKNSLFKRPGDPVSVENNLLKRARMMLEEEGRPLREISSVMMTTSGFLSPAREGKLPEARTPTQFWDSRSSSPQPLSYPTVPPEVKGEKKSKKLSNRSTAESTRKLVDKEMSKTKDTTSSQNTEDDDPNVKKLVSMKEMYKLKALKPGAIKMHSPNNGVKKANKHKNAPGMSAMISALPKIPKLNQKNSKNEKSTGGQNSSKSSNDKTKDKTIDGKLSSEPDKQKLNIFKKISKVKEDKQEVSDGSKTDSGPSEESRHRDIISETIEAVIQKSRERPAAGVTPEKSEVTEVESSDSELFCYNDDLSPPGTPSTPRTPDLVPPQKKPNKHQDSKKKKKGKRDRDKKDSHSSSPKRFKSESTESDYSLLDKPKTPEVESSRDDIVPMLPRNREDMMASNVFQFFPFAPGPGLIPPPITPNNPLFSRLNMPLGKQAASLMLHPTMPNLPLPPPLLGHPSLEPQVKRSLSPPPRPVSRSSPTPTPATVSSVSAPSPVSEVVATDTTISPPKDKSGEKKKEKEHKKEKKEKIKIKIKKKKDKKEKLKNKDKEEKKKIKSGKKIKDKKNKEKKDKKEKKKEKEREEKEKEKEKGEGSVPKLTLKLGPSSPQPGAPPAPPEPTHRKIVIKPIEPPREVKEERRSPSPELARISALVTRPSNSKPPVAMPVAPVSDDTSASPSPSTVSVLSVNLTRAPKPPKKPVQVDSDKKEPLAFYFDNDGNQVWICPACGGQDDGSPMIGCDGCDAWYHWVCVGIQVPPDSNDWFCRVCISKKQDGLPGEKKKKGDRRKKKTGSS